MSVLPTHIKQFDDIGSKPASYISFVKITRSKTWEFKSNVIAAAYFHNSLSFCRYHFDQRFKNRACHFFPHTYTYVCITRT